MSIIYRPKGKAREYSPLAANLYLGCNHGCKYCYAPSIQFKKKQDYSKPIPRRNLLRDFELDCKKHYNSEDQVLFCFMTDPYNNLESELRLTRECLKIALKHKIPIALLTKSKTVLNDIDIIKKFGENIKVGFTLTFDNKKDSLKWEPETTGPMDRLSALKALKENGIKTWASFEPVIIPEQSIKMIELSLPYVDEYKIGKLNNYKGLDKKIDWNAFLANVVSLLRGNKPFYIKHDLRVSANNIMLFGNEVLMDEFNLGRWING